MNKLMVLMTTALLMTQPAVYASQTPLGLASDPRIKVVSYDPNNVVTIQGNHQVETAIEFDKDEVILLVESGDSTAWASEISKNVPYMLYLKPTLPSSDTNLLIVTTERRYQFHLITSSTDQNTKEVTYLIVFKYPEKEKQKIENQLSTLQHTLLGSTTVSNPTQPNYQYSFYGSKLIAPIQAVDNGKFTLFKFPDNTNIPAIFSVDSHRHESMVNFSVDNDTVFVQGVFRQFTFRNGEDVTTVYNDHYKIN